MQQNITKSAKFNGLIVGVLLSLKFILSAQKSNLFAFLALFISILIIVALYRMAIRFRDLEGGGTIKYKQALLYIFLIYVFGSIISSFVVLLYTSFIDKSYLGLQFNVLMKIYDSWKITFDDKSFKALEYLYTVPAPYALLNVFAGIIGGGFWGLILAGFVKKEKNIFEE